MRATNKTQDLDLWLFGFGFTVYRVNPSVLGYPINTDTLGLVDYPSSPETPKALLVMSEDGRVLHRLNPSDFAPTDEDSEARAWLRKQMRDSGINFDYYETEQDSEVKILGTVHNVDDGDDGDHDDDAPVYILSSDDEEDDDESITSTEFRQRKMPFRGDRSFMLGRQPVAEKPTPQKQRATTPHTSIDQDAQEFKNQSNLNEDKIILLIDKIAKSVRDTVRDTAILRTKANSTRDLHRKKREQLKKKAKEVQGKMEEFPIPLHEKACHIDGNYPENPTPVVCDNRPAVVMRSQNSGCSVDYLGELFDRCNRLESYRSIPKITVVRRIKEAEEVVRLLRQQLRPSDPIPRYAKIYVAILTKLTFPTIEEILEHLEEERSRVGEHYGESTSYLELFCPRCQIYGCSIHDLVDAKNYSHRTAAEVAMWKEEAGYWEEVSKNKPILCVPIDKTQDLSHSQQTLAKKLFYMYEGDTVKVAKALGVPEHSIEKAMLSDRNQPPAQYQYVKKINASRLNRFHGYQQGQKYYRPYAYGNEPGHYVPCTHAGPCLKETCSCIQTRNACTNNCIMGPLSKNFFPGCRCKDGCFGFELDPDNDSTYKCNCLKAGRECDPELCQCGICTSQDGVLEETRRRLCLNDNVQMRREIRGLYLGQSTIPGAGRGLFCDKNIRAGTYIGEYVGELITEKEVQRRLEAQENLEYLFALTNHYSLDALREGNLTRYMNHSTYKSQTNVRGTVIRVDGDPRIAFIAKTDIPANKEMFFDYGKTYKTDFSSRKAKKQQEQVPDSIGE